MASRAPLRILPGDPHRLLGWLARDRRRWGKLLLGRALLVVGALAAYAAVVGATLAFWILVTAFLLLARIEPSRPKAPQAPSPSPGPVFEGGIEVRRQGTLLVEDQAVVTFVEGWLHVEGWRTSFALSARDLARPDPIPPGLAFVTTYRRLVASLLGGAPFAPLTPEAFRRVWLADGTEIRFDVPHGKPGYPAPGSKVDLTPPFERGLKAWRSGLPASGDSVFPPDRPHPAALARTRVDLAVSLARLAVGGLVAGTHGAGWGLASFLLIPGPRFGRAILDYARLRRVEGPKPVLRPGRKVVREEKGPLQ